jgi:predicted Abi (CAAX) family protease
MARFIWQRKYRLKRFILLTLLMGLCLLWFYPAAPLNGSESPSRSVVAYAMTQQSPSSPEDYPLQQNINSKLYLPVAAWLGRLILPDQPNPTAIDWVWFEVYNAPPQYQALVGQVVRLEWSKERQVQLDAQAVTQDVNFTPAAEASQRSGNIHPVRLNHRPQVGALQSLAGARPQDNVTVALKAVKVISPSLTATTLQIAAEPVQVTGRFYGLVQILGPDLSDRAILSRAHTAANNSQPAPSPAIQPPCPGELPCPSEVYQVVHYNPVSGKFDGTRETVRIPQVLPDWNWRFQSTPRDIEKSTVGIEGWYIYGAKNQDGQFVVQAMQPRSLIQLQPQQVILGQSQGLNYIHHHQWQEITKGTLHTVLVDPQATQPQEALAQWQEGDRALVVHLFGGIGGAKAESNAVPATVTGHFAYGVAEVVRDRLTGELQWDLTYSQIYAHNPNGIIAGATRWMNYMGDLQRGWLGARPVADVLVRWEPLTQDYRFDEIVLSPLNELQRQLSLMMARYRVGDGTGAALVKPALSCVQDSNQAVYQTLKSIEAQIQRHPKIQTWLNTHPDHPQTKRFQQLVRLGRDLEKTLIPLGIVRPDWKTNTDRLAGIQSIPNLDSNRERDEEREWAREDSWLTQLLSWRTVLPKAAHDIQPLAPTQLLGQYYFIPNTFSRLIESLQWPDWKGWLIAFGMLLLYGAIALPLGMWQRFLYWDRSWEELSGWQIGQLSLKLLVMPALLEEIVFRIVLIPHPQEGVDGWTTLLWIGLSLLLFILYHPLNALTFYPNGFPTFFRSAFLSLTALLGLVCSLVYQWVGSLWAIVLIHWIVVSLWIIALGGRQKLEVHPARQAIP